MLIPGLTGIVPRLNFSATTSLLIIYISCLSPILLLLYFQFSSRRNAAREPKGCRKLGLHGFSNLHDENNYGIDGRPKRTNQNDAGRGKIRVKALLAYPIKSCAGVEFNIADVVSTGVAYDRQFCFAEYVDSAESGAKSQKYEKPAGQWVFRTMRDLKYAKLALIRPEIWVPDPSSSTYSPKRPEVRSKGVLVINFPRIPSGSGITPVLLSIGMKLGLCAREESFHVPLHPPPSSVENGAYPSRSVRIWRDTPMAFDYGKHIPPSLLAFLGASRPMTLFRIDPDHHRKVFRCAPRKEVLGFQATTGFADAYPVHMLSLASLREIAERTKYAIPKLSARRFRPNVILEGSAAFEEDDWKRVRFIPRNGKQMPNKQVEDGIEKREGQNGAPEDNSNRKHSSENADEGVEVYTACRTVRCRLPNVDPKTGVRHPVEPDKTLKSFRCIDAGDPYNACFGMQCVPTVEEFTLRVGDEVKVLEKGEHFYIKM
ncbi:MOSC domain-containing protein [Histoplasma capsulatum]|uniref:MOSC domain-containing protein n=1 Tax=Ajellomyces capsulatus TaxID=5037 RepID=A0A8A1MC69_AJECA|nr:predicted protein [Histoplasma mississippiense (nom. inval.)]EDN10703.1 predicted protein [Histoplasma mississippiense (nom. inval.)]QSS64178.1 MOSC domain-containing protein [Histoplasma capsulatum]